MTAGPVLRRDAPVPPRPPGRWRGLRALVLRIHFYAGLLVGPFLLVAAVTGLLYTVAPQLERWVHADALTVPVSGPRVPLAAQVSAAVAARPGLPVTGIRPAPEPGATTRVSFDAGLPESYARTVFVDPYTARIVATEDTYAEWLPVRGVLDNLHRSLLLGPPGQVYTELAASWLAVLAASGLVVALTRRARAGWLPVRQVRARRPRLWGARERRPRGWRPRERRPREWRPRARRPRTRRPRTRRPRTRRRGGSARARLRSWHGAVGIAASAGFLFLAATGLTWSQFAGSHVTALRAALDWTTPTVSVTLPAGASAAVPVAAVPATAQRVLDAARADGLGGPVEIVPGDPGQAWRVQQTVRSWPSQQDAVAVAPDTAVITDRLAFADWPLAAKLARWGVDAHMGILFGVANQVALAALACALIVLVAGGYRMWWLRRPRLPGTGPAGPPGSPERPSTASVALLGGVGVVAGVVLPVLGVSLIAFLVLDAVLAARRGAAPHPGAGRPGLAEAARRSGRPG